MLSDYLVFMDESGDHGLESIDPQYPIFVLVSCIVSKADYANVICPSVQRLKFDYFGHDLTILHSHEIRKAIGEFSILLNPNVRGPFIDRLTNVVADAPFTLVASAIDKTQLKKRYAYPENPYEIALLFCLERTYAHLRDLGQHDRRTTICVESRGRKEDNALELAFRRIVAGANYWGVLPFDLRFANKQTNSAGLQLADLVGHPVGRKLLRPDQPNAAYDVIEPKFRRNPYGGGIDGWGRKVFP